MHAFTLAWWTRATAPGMRTCLVLVVCYRFGDQMISGLIAPFLHDQAIGTETVALMKGAAGSATSLLGAVLGGWWLMQVTRRQALLYAGCAQALTFLLYGLVALGHGGMNLLWTATLLEGLLSTLATVALFAWMMDAADPDHASADYTLMASVGVMVIGVAGVMGAALADALGYAPVFALGAGLCVLGTWVMVRTKTAIRCMNESLPHGEITKKLAWPPSCRIGKWRKSREDAKQCHMRWGCAGQMHKVHKMQ